MRNLLLCTVLSLLVLGQRLGFAQKGAVAQLMQWWPANHYTVAWTSVQFDQRGGLLFIARDRYLATRLFHLRLGHRPDSLAMPYQVLLTDKVQLGAITPAGQQLSILTCDPTTKGCEVRRLLWAGKAVTEYLPAWRVKPVNEKLLRWDEYGLLACGDGAGHLVAYYNGNSTDTSSRPLPNFLPPITSARLVNEAGLTLLGTEHTGGGRDYALYDYTQNKSLTGFEYDRAEFLTSRLVKLRHRSDATWHLLACPKSGRQKPTGSLRTVLVRDTAEATALINPDEAKALRKWPWRYAAIGTDDTLRWYNDTLKAIVPIKCSVDGFWWLPGGRGGAVHCKGAGWQRLESGPGNQIKTQPIANAQQELRPLTVTWFLSRDASEAFYTLRRFDNPKYRDTMQMPVPSTAQLWPLYLAQRSAPAGTDRMLLTWRDSTGSRPWHAWILAVPGPEAQAKPSQANNDVRTVPLPPAVRVKVVRHRAADVAVVGKLLLTNGDATDPTPNRWQAWLPCLPANQQPQLRYSDLTRQSFRLPNQAGHHYFEVFLTNSNLLTPSILLELTDAGLLRQYP